MYGFGFVGIISIFISLAMSSYMIVLKIMGEDIGNRPLLMFALILGLTGVQLFSFGLLSELLIRTYHESQNRPIYRIRSIISTNQNWIFYLNLFINKAEISTTSGDVSLKPCRKIDNVDLSDNSSAIFNAFNLSSVFPWKRLNILFLWEFL